MKKRNDIIHRQRAVVALLTTLLTLCLVSCTNDSEQPTDGSKPVTFGGTLEEGMQQTAGTRAEGLENKSVTTFRVYGYKNTAYDTNTGSYNGLQTVFPGYTVTWTVNTAGSTTSNQYDWEYVNGSTQTIKYWDYAAKAYRFLAYAPATAAVTKYSTANTTTFTFAADATSNATPYYSKLWFSNNNYPNHVAYGSGIILNFVQPLCRVRILFVDEEGHAVTTASPVYAKTLASSIQFKPSDTNQSISLKGTVTVVYPLMGTGKTETVTIEASTEAADKLAAITVPYEEEGQLAFADMAEKWYTTLPVGTQEAYTLSLQFSGKERTAVVPAEFMTWEQGRQYTYVFKLTDQELAFMPDLYVYTKWQAGYASQTEW